MSKIEEENVCTDITKKSKKWHKTLNSYMNYISYELESLTGQSYDTLIQEIWTNYQAEMLERFPYIGGDAASGTKNLIGAYMFVSMGEVLKNMVLRQRRAVT